MVPVAAHGLAKPGIKRACKGSNLACLVNNLASPKVAATGQWALITAPKQRGLLLRCKRLGVLDTAPALLGSSLRFRRQSDLVEWGLATALKPPVWHLKLRCTGVAPPILGAWDCVPRL